MGAKMWLSPEPKTCDICEAPINGLFFDANVRGTWGILCSTCFKDNDCSLGIGYGQEYRMLDDRKYYCVAGTQPRAGRGHG